MFNIRNRAKHKRTYISFEYQTMTTLNYALHSKKAFKNHTLPVLFPAERLMSVCMYVCRGIGSHVFECFSLSPELGSLYILCINKISCCGRKTNLETTLFFYKDGIFNYKSFKNKYLSIFLLMQCAHILPQKMFKFVCSIERVTLKSAKAISQTSFIFFFY